jgi:hypothetical protein
MDIAEFIGARLAEDEASATTLRELARETIERLKEPRFLGREIPAWGTWPDVEAMCIRALRDVEAKRAIIAAHAKADEWVNVSAGATAGYARLIMDDTMRAIAAIWNDHPDYREEWKP